MEKLEKQELITIIGGINITGTVVNAFVSAGKFIYSLGQSLGTSIRRIGCNQVCKI